MQVSLASGAAFPALVSSTRDPAVGSDILEADLSPLDVAGGEGLSQVPAAAALLPCCDCCYKAAVKHYEC